MTHLWEVYHPYYCEASPWCEHQGRATFASWAEFTETSFYDGDRDQNLLIRWDWRADSNNGHQLQLFFVLQRKPIFAAVTVTVVPEDEPAVRPWLIECAQTLAATWQPLLTASASLPDGMAYGYPVVAQWEPGS